MADCTCFVTPEHTWFRYGSAVEPGSQMEPNPDCPVHFPTRRTNLIRVRRSKHSSNHRADGHFNWKVEDHRHGVTFIFRDFNTAITQANHLAWTGFVNGERVVASYRMDPDPSLVAAVGVWHLLKAAYDEWEAANV